ncbi:MAG: peptide transporter ATP-binding protein [Chlamydiales bacterium]|jgi:peptide/nickel transport system ATP-binding protein/oligopeptide transport system ATP-binding protein|nr:peptide transporter ATP-binding protein [Chlamydiales bacterium]
MQRTLVSIQNLSKHFYSPKHILRAVNNFSLDIFAGETIGLVGESGCGKSTAGRAIIRLYEPSSGKVFFEGRDICKLSSKEMKAMRKEIQIIFQDPYASLNPRMTVEDIIGESLDIHNLATSRNARRDKVQELLSLVGLKPEHMTRYPHEFSGGQRQRMSIARALAVKPKFIVCDEPTSALDVSVQSQIVNLLQTLQREKGLTYLFISHNLPIVKYIADRVAVMYLGNMVELAESDELYRNPLHPYTQSLLSAIPVPDPEQERKRTRIVLTGELPSPMNPPKGCPFHTRCPFAKKVCQNVMPAWKEIKPNHFTACHLY